MENNEIAFYIQEQTQGTQTEFKQTDQGFFFNIDGEEVLRIQKDGQCFKKGKGITDDLEVFKSLKDFMKIFKEVYDG